MSIENLNLSDTLFSKVRQRILGQLFVQPDRDYHTNELIRLTRMGSGAVQRELEKLSRVGLIIVQVVGNQKRYKANKDSLLYEEIRNIVLKTFGLAAVMRQALEPIQNKIDIAFIYGSIAKQSDTVTSDIDVMIIGKDLTYGDFFEIIADAETKLERKINPTFHEPKEWMRKIKDKNHFLTKITKQPKIYLIGNENELKGLG